jgi:hypothetical protein
MTTPRYPGLADLPALLIARETLGTFHAALSIIASLVDDLLWMKET